MRSEIVQYAGIYESAVLTALDRNGYPFSLRCGPRLDNEAQALCLILPDGAEVTPGPTCLLWHRHDERLGQMGSFVVRGTLVNDNAGWFIRPEAFIPGVGIGGWRSYMRFLVNGRRATRRYLERRGLARPQINWDEWDAITAQVR
jgi:hypothetical protein